MFRIRYRRGDGNLPRNTDLRVDEIYAQIRAGQWSLVGEVLISNQRWKPLASIRREADGNMFIRFHEESETE